MESFAISPTSAKTAVGNEIAFEAMQKVGRMKIFDQITEAQRLAREWLAKHQR